MSRKVKEEVKKCPETQASAEFKDELEKIKRIQARRSRAMSVQVADLAPPLKPVTNFGHGKRSNLKVKA